MKLYFICPQCPGERIREGTEHLHPHVNLQLVLSPLLLEVARLGNMICNRAIKVSQRQPADPAPLNCHACANIIGFGERASICLSAKCIWIYCHVCTDAKCCHHRHRLYEVVINRKPEANLNMVRCCTCSEIYIACQSKDYGAAIAIIMMHASSVSRKSTKDRPNCQRDCPISKS